jgi:hypothetical protein
MQRADGNWYCPQPKVKFLGLALLPVFINGLAQDPPTNTVTVTILEARTDIEKYSRANQVVANVMKQSQFTGKSVIWALEGSDQGICQLEIDLSLTIQIPLPKFSISTSWVQYDWKCHCGPDRSIPNEAIARTSP